MDQLWILCASEQDLKLKGRYFTGTMAEMDRAGVRVKKEGRVTLLELLTGKPKPTLSRKEGRAIRLARAAETLKAEN